MRAEVGDWLVVPDPYERHNRRGQVIQLLHPDGTPPYRVRWLDDDHLSVVFPPPDAHLLPADPGHNRSPGAGGTSVPLDAPGGSR